MRKLGLLASVLVLGGSASADELTFSFTGVVTGGTDAVGSSITGSMTLDPASRANPVYSDTDGATFSTVFNDSPLPTNPLQLSGNICSVTTCINILEIPGGVVQSDVYLQKNYLGTYNLYSLNLINFDPGDVFTPVLSIATSDTKGAASNIFSTPGLALDQPVDWFADGAVTTGSFSKEAGAPGEKFFRDGFTITSMKVVSAPEPSTFALMAAGLLVVGFSIKRRLRDN